MGAVQILSTVNGYNKYLLSTGRVIEEGSCSLPPLEYETTAFWIDFPERISFQLRKKGHVVAACTHAANHAILLIAQLIAQCDTTDVGCPHISSHASGVETSRVLIYDKRPGGMGIAETLYKNKLNVLEQAKSLCLCTNCHTSSPSSSSSSSFVNNGCTACLLDHTCPMRNNNMDKNGAILLLTLLIEDIKCMKIDGSSDDNDNKRIQSSTQLLCPEISGKDDTNHGEKAIKNQKDDNTPRRMKRARALQIAKDLVKQREEGMKLQKTWIDALPNFQGDSSST